MNNRPCTSIKGHHFRWILEPSFELQWVLALCAAERWELHGHCQRADISNIGGIARKATKHAGACGVEDVAIEAANLPLDVPSKVSRSSEENTPHDGF